MHSRLQPIAHGSPWVHVGEQRGLTPTPSLPPYYSTLLPARCSLTVCSAAR